MREPQLVRHEPTERERAMRALGLGAVLGILLAVLSRR
jgi:hypothetical protein